MNVTRRVRRRPGRSSAGRSTRPTALGAVGHRRPRAEQPRARRLLPTRRGEARVAAAAHARGDRARRVRPLRRQLLGRARRPRRVGGRPRRRARPRSRRRCAAQRNSAGSKPAFWYRAHAAGLALEAGEVDRAEAIFADGRPGGRARRPCGGAGSGSTSPRSATTSDERAALRRRARSRSPRRRRRHRSAAGPRPRPGDAARRHRRPTRSQELFDRLPIGFGHRHRHDDPYRLLARAELLEARGDLEAALDDVRGVRSRVPAPGPSGRARHRARRRGPLPRRARAGSTRPRSTPRSPASSSRAGAGPGSRSWRRCNAGSAAARRSRAPPSSRHAKREVVALLAEGLTNGEIAARLFISPKTASVHVSNILAKLSMTSRAEIAAYAVRAGWPTPERRSEWLRCGTTERADGSADVGFGVQCASCGRSPSSRGSRRPWSPPRFRPTSRWCTDRARFDRCFRPPRCHRRAPGVPQRRTRPWSRRGLRRVVSTGSTGHWS